jgi:hypothetical protein
MAPVIEVLIGLTFLFLILSLVVSAVNEGVAGLFGWRATYLEKGIKSLLGDVLTGKFFDHSLIKSLSDTDAKLPWNRKPSYVSASTFTETVLDLVREAQPPKTDTSDARSTSSADDFMTKLRERLQTGTIPEPVVRDALRIFSEAASDLEDFKTRVDAWFEEAMNRVSGWYKRYTRLWMMLIGFLLVIVVNADTINITKTLWRDAAIRTAVVEQAASVAGGDQPDPAQASDQLKRLEELNVPLGWVLTTGTTDPRGLPSDVGQVLIKILGLLITVVALSFGATFWFDFLKKFVGIRSSGAEPQPAQTGPPSGAAEAPHRLLITTERASTS